MNILAIDTATEGCSAAVLAAGRLYARFEELDRDHAARILPMAHEVLEEAGLRLSGLRAVAFGRGPGAFTGVRLAASVAQGLAFGAGLPVMPVSNLRALAQRALDRLPQADRVLACADARMREVYWAEFMPGPGGLAVPASVERVGPPSAVCPSAEPSACIGRGFAAYPELADRFRAVGLMLMDDAALPRAVEIARLAATDVEAGHAVPAEEALPTYLRNDVARPQPAH